MTMFATQIPLQTHTSSSIHLSTPWSAFYQKWCFSQSFSAGFPEFSENPPLSYTAAWDTCLQNLVHELVWQNGHWCFGGWRTELEKLDWYLYTSSWPCPDEPIDLLESLWLLTVQRLVVTWALVFGCLYTEILTHLSWSEYLAWTFLVLPDDIILFRAASIFPSLCWNLPQAWFARIFLERSQPWHVYKFHGWEKVDFYTMIILPNWAEQWLYLDQALGSCR